MDIEAFLPLFFGFGVFAIVLAVSLFENRKRRRAWGSLAADLELEFIDDENAIVGLLDGVNVAIRIEVRGSGKSRQTFTVFDADVILDVPPDLSLYRQGFLSSVSKFFGGQDIEIRHKEFDDRFMIKGHDELEITRWLADHTIRQVLLDLSRFNQTTSLKQGTLAFERSGAVTDRTKLEADLRKLVGAARALKKTSASNDPATAEAQHAPSMAALDEVTITADASVVLPDRHVDAELEEESEVLW